MDDSGQAITQKRKTTVMTETKSKRLMFPKSFPPFMTLEVTMQCNYQCPYCYCFWHEFPKSVGHELDPVEWMDLIDYCISKGVKRILFSGGEALLRCDIRELLDYTVQKDSQIAVSLFTNGSLMDETMLLFCKDRSIEISTSLQGLKTHGIMTGVNTGYRKTLELIALGRQLDWPIAVSIVVTKENQEEIRNIFSAAALCGASMIQLGPMMPEGRGRNHLEWILSKEEWNSVKQEIRSVKDFGIPYVFCDEMICTCRSHSPQITDLFPRLRRSPCEAGKTFGVIGPDGLYRKCLHYPPVSGTTSQSGNSTTFRDATGKTVETKK